MRAPTNKKRASCPLRRRRLRLLPRAWSPVLPACEICWIRASAIHSRGSIIRLLASRTITNQGTVKSCAADIAAPNVTSARIGLLLSNRVNPTKSCSGTSFLVLRLIDKNSSI
ncbi:hypothetical protein SETIT_8G170800v2 [Setaria italica]|uniref:Uncharacterized protein n=1 Tax=Setaria italica TaxID=4555 RepID=A0A368S8X4_SETIT|nr:hypothetical protein SETIT_8G170800v2 [Setaria italica]